MEPRADSGVDHFSFAVPIITDAWAVRSDTKAGEVADIEQWGLF